MSPRRDGHRRRGRRRPIIVRGEESDEREYIVPRGAKIRVEDGEQVTAGDQLTEGRRTRRRCSHPGPRGGPALPRRRGAEGLSLAGREHQRQAHRGHRPPDAAQGAHRRSRATRSCCRASWSTASSSRRRTAEVLAEGGEPATAQPVLLGVTKASPEHRAASSRRPPSRRRRGCSPRRRSTAQGRPAARPEGERHHRQAHPGRDGRAGARQRPAARARAPRAHRPSRLEDLRTTRTTKSCWTKTRLWKASTPSGHPGRPHREDPRARVAAASSRGSRAPSALICGQFSERSGDGNSKSPH